LKAVTVTLTGSRPVVQMNTFWNEGGAEFVAALCLCVSFARDAMLCT